MLDHSYSLQKVITAWGSQKSLAEALSIKPCRINDWLNKHVNIPFQFATALEDLSIKKGIFVSRFDLAPYARFLNRKTVDARVPEKMPEFTWPLLISERVYMGMDFEKSQEDRRRQKKQNSTDTSNADNSFLKGKTSHWAAGVAGFRSRDTYLRAKIVVCFGLLRLVKAMDAEQLSISGAAKIAKLPLEEQEAYLDKLEQEFSLSIQKPVVQKNDKVMSGLQSLLQNRAHLINFFLDPDLVKAEKKSCMPIKLYILFLIGETDEQGYFLWDESIFKNNPLITDYVSFHQVRDSLADIGLVNSVTLENKQYGRLLLNNEKIRTLN